MDCNNCIVMHKSHHLQHEYHPHFRITSVVILLMIIPSLVAEDIPRIDPLALLSGTLRTYQTAGCDYEFVKLQCPRGTTISIEFAQYGKYGNSDPNDPGLCPETTENTQNDANVINSGTEIEVKTPEKCMWPVALQYSLLQTVVEACQKKHRCKFLSSPKTFGGDPCPGHRKFIEVAYKCRPSEFRSKVACENDVMTFECNPYSRIAINAASFGRTEYESLQCPQTPGIKEENCLASYATETVMQYCHGRRKCIITADQKTFGKPCQPQSRMYLKVVYTCVPRKVLIDRFESTPEPDEPLQFDELEPEQDELYDDDQFYKETDIGPAPKLQGDPSKKTLKTLEGPIYSVTSSIGPPQRNRDDTSLEENQERLYLLLIVSVTSGVILCLVIVVTRMLWRRRKSNDGSTEQGKNGGQFKTSTTGETTITNGFSTDDISEIDADIDLTTPLPMATNANITRNDNYSSYTPSPSPYGNLGPSNISHTSSTLLMPQSSISSSGTGPPSIMSGSINPAMMLPSPNAMSGFVNMSALGGTLPRQHPVVSMSGLSLIPQPSYFSGPTQMMGHPTLRRQSSHEEQNMPRILSRNAANVQYYYG